MGEKKGFLAVMLIFGLFMIPLLFNIYTNNVKTSKLLTISTEMQQLVSTEGGITNKVKNAVTKLQGEGIKIEFKDGNGNVVNNKVPVGEEIFIYYDYDGFKTSNSVIITKR